MGTDYDREIMDAIRQDLIGEGVPKKLLEYVEALVRNEVRDALEQVDLNDDSVFSNLDDRVRYIERKFE
jgi:hypothetical protein